MSVNILTFYFSNESIARLSVSIPIGAINSIVMATPVIARGHSAIWTIAHHGLSIWGLVFINTFAVQGVVIEIYIEHTNYNTTSFPKYPQ